MTDTASRCISWWRARFSAGEVRSSGRGDVMDVVPGVSNLRQFERWTFAEFATVFEIDLRFNELMDQFRSRVPAGAAA
jgi:hypothetical protein